MPPKVDQDNSLEKHGLIGNIEQFDPEDDFELYNERFDNLMELNSVVEDGKKTTLLIAVIGPETYGVLRNLAAPKKVKEVKYEDIIKLLKKHFKPGSNIISERYKFNMKTQESSESVSDFILELKIKSQTCEFKDFLDEALRDRFVAGISSDKIKSRLLSEKDLTWDKACEIALSLEMAESNKNQMATKNVNYFRGRSKSRGRNQRSYSGGYSKQYEHQSKNRSSSSGYQRGNSNHRGKLDSRKCFKCHKPGHFAKQCRFNRSGNKNNKFENKNKNVEGEINSLDIHMISIDKNNTKLKLKKASIKNNVNGESVVLSSNYPNSHRENNVMVNKVDNESYSPSENLTLNIEGHNLEFEIDTGSPRTVWKWGEYKKLINKKIYPYNTNLSVITGDPVTVVGAAKVNVSKPDSNNFWSLEIALLDSKRNFKPLLGRDWLDKLFPNWRQNFLKEPTINSIESDIDRYVKKEVLEKYSKVFSKDLSEPIKDFEVDIVMKPDVTPIFMGAYTLPYGLKPKVEALYKKEIEMGILTPVRHSMWATPVIIREKASGELRTCLNCKATINKFIVTDHYPLPRIDDIFATLAGCRFFCKLDMTGAYKQLKVSEKSQHLLTINTHMGLMRYNRLVDGISSAPSNFQSVMDQILQGLERVKTMMDDILIGGSTLEECKGRLQMVMQKLLQYNVKLKLEKCLFFVDKVKYLGHIVSGQGIEPNPEKVEAVVQAPAPKNVQQLQAYLGLLNFYGKFIPNLSSELHPLHKLLQKDVKFDWVPECEKSFERSKELLLNSDILTLYDPSKPIVLTCDASPYGVGAILSHIIDGVERPVIFASTTLSKAEQNYAQLHREALAIMFGVRKFHKYIYGHKITIISDHEPLKGIFNEKRNDSGVAAARLQRWSLMLSQYDYKIEYRKASKVRHADALSRLPVEGETGVEENFINFFNFSDDHPLTLDEIRKATHEDLVLSKVYDGIKNGKTLVDLGSMKLKFYEGKRASLAIEDGCLWYNFRVVVPASLQSRVLDLLHKTHIGMIRMKSVAREKFWWKGIDLGIELFVKGCTVCNETQNRNPNSNLVPWPKTIVPYQRVHIDFFHFNQKEFLILVDSFSKFAEVLFMTNTNCKSVTAKLRANFSIFGIPTEIVSDNGPPFNSKDWTDFCGKNGIKFSPSPAYHPQSNGLAERGVQTVKLGLKKALRDEKTKNLPIQAQLDNFLFKYRNTPTTVTGETPASLLFKYKPRTLIDYSYPNQNSEIDSPVVDRTEVELSEPKIQIEELTKGIRGIKSFEKNELVMYQYNFKNNVKWVEAKIINKLSGIRYKIQVKGTNFKIAHIDQLKKLVSKKVRFAEKYCNQKEPHSVASNKKIVHKSWKRIKGRLVANYKVDSKALKKKRGRKY